MRLTIGKRLSLGFLLLILITAAIGIISVTYFSKLNSITKRISQRYFPRIATVNEAKDAVQGLERALTSYSLGSKSAEGETEVHKHIELVKFHLDSLIQLHSSRDTAFQNWLDRFNQNLAIVEKDVLALIEAPKQSQKVKPTQSLTGIFKITEQLKKECNRLRKDVLEDIDRLSIEARAQSLAGYRWVFILLSLGLLASMILAYLATSSLVKPIRKFMQATEVVAKGDLDVRLQITGPDELKQLAHCFQDMTKKLKDAFEQQKFLVGVVSHQLRTPLTIIRGNAEVTLRGRNQTLEDYQAVLKNIISTTQQMNSFITKLLTLTQAEFGQVQLNLTKIKLKELVAEISQDSQILAHEKGLKLELIFEPEGVILGDRERLKELFFILLDNSIKYTNPSGTIKMVGTRDTDWLKISISDTGIGIPKEDLPYVFERFYRSQKNRANIPQGAGIGLAIARWIIETHKGKIYAESPEGKGTIITVLLPILKQEK